MRTWVPTGQRCAHLSEVLTSLTPSRLPQTHPFLLLSVSFVLAGKCEDKATAYKVYDAQQVLANILKD